MGPGGRDPMFPVQFRPVESFAPQGMPFQGGQMAYGVPFNPLGAPGNPLSQPAPVKPAALPAAQLANVIAGRGRGIGSGLVRGGGTDRDHGAGRSGSDGGRGGGGRAGMSGRDRGNFGH
jgi:hypothetical protein